jgi:glucose dehydrogenase
MRSSKSAVARAVAAVAALATLAAPAAAQVPYARLRDAASEPGSWLTYSGGCAAHRFSALAEVTPANVGRLRTAWVYQVREAGLVETTPLVADGVLYLTEARSRVAALDVRTGRTLWRYEPDLPKDLKTLGFPPVNRGVALLGDRVFVGTLDAQLVALDALSGSVRATRSLRPRSRATAR